MSMHQTDADRWLKQANEDLATAKILFEAERYGPCAFYCQQAAEKALKAVLYAAGERPWGHSIPSLLDQACAVLGIGPAEAPTAEVEVLDGHRIRAGAAAPDVKVARAAAEAGIAGFTFLRGIPGAIGGALRMNGGAYGGEVKDILVEAHGVRRDGSAAIDVGPQRIQPVLPRNAGEIRRQFRHIGGRFPRRPSVLFRLAHRRSRQVRQPYSNTT